MPETLFNSELTSLPLVSRGKVRDIYGVGEDHLLIVTTDRLSAFDVVLPTPIPGKGAVLTAVSNFWFERTRDLIPNHLSELSLEEVLPDAAERDQVAGRAIVVRKLAPLPVEAIVRGYLAGSGWKDYQRTQATTSAARRSAASRCRRACTRPTSCPSRCSPRRPRPSSAPTTRTSPSSG
jgi:phosphoribosylaminoimidazole-succinocarboxamide synthase